MQALKPNSMTLPERVAVEIKRYIIEKHLREGDRLPSEHEMAEQLNVSRASIREALATLAAIGIVDIRVGRGAFVRDFSMKTLTDHLPYGLEFHYEEMTELVEIRQLLEVYAVRKVATKLTTEQLAQFHSIIQEMGEKAARGEDFIDQDIHFHEAIAAIAGKSVLQFLLRGFWEVQRKNRKVNTDRTILQQRYQEHLAIFQALEAGDVDAAAKCMDEHFTGLEQRLGQAGEMC